MLMKNKQLTLTLILIASHATTNTIDLPSSSVVIATAVGAAGGAAVTRIWDKLQQCGQRIAYPELQQIINKLEPVKITATTRLCSETLVNSLKNDLREKPTPMHSTQKNYC